MRVDEYVAILRADGDALARAAARAGPDATVPACPGWPLRDLVRHLGGVHRWAAAHVATGRRDPMPAEDERAFFISPADHALLDWFRTGHRALVETLARADPGLDCWTFLPAPSPLAFWARRQAHETAIHRADAEAAAGAVTAAGAETTAGAQAAAGVGLGWPPEFALDGTSNSAPAMPKPRGCSGSAVPGCSTTGSGGQP